MYYNESDFGTILTTTRYPIIDMNVLDSSSPHIIAFQVRGGMASSRMSLGGTGILPPSGSSAGSGPASLAVGNRVVVSGRKGEVKFIGTTEFAEGEWVGVALDNPEGKNDGSVKGVKYFDCVESHGLFVKRAQVKIDMLRQASSRPSRQSLLPSSKSLGEDGATKLPAPKPARQSLLSPAKGAVEDDDKSVSSTQSISRPTSRLAVVRARNEKLKRDLEESKFSLSSSPPRPSSPKSTGSAKSVNNLGVTASSAAATATAAGGSAVFADAAKVQQLEEDLASSRSLVTSLRLDMEAKDVGFKAKQEELEAALRRAEFEVDAKETAHMAEQQERDAALKKLTLELKDMESTLKDRQNEADAHLKRVSEDLAMKEEVLKQKEAEMDGVRKRVEQECRSKEEAVKAKQEAEAALKRAEMEQRAKEDLVKSLTEDLSDAAKKLADFRDLAAAEAAAVVVGTPEKPPLSARDEIVAPPSPSPELVAETTELKTRVREAESLAERWKAEAEKMQLECDRSKDVADSCRSEADRARAEAERFKDERNRANGQAQNAASDAEKMRADCKAARGDAEATMSQLEECKHEMARLSGELERALSGSEKLKTECERVKEELRSAKLEAEAAKDGAETIKEQIEVRLAVAEERALAAEARETEAADRAQGANAEKLQALHDEVTRYKERQQELEGELRGAKERADAAVAGGKEGATALAKERASAASWQRKFTALEGQVSELNDAIEGITLAKEEVELEKETLEEELLLLKEELEECKLDAEHAKLTAHDEEGDHSEDARAALEQNRQLREALKRLHQISTQDKSELARVSRSLEKMMQAHEAMEQESSKLKEWKDQTEVALEELKEQVDEGRAFEEMVETLTEKNLSLGEKQGEMQQLLSDLEMSLELSEEIEAQQGEEIKSLRRKLDAADVRESEREMSTRKLHSELSESRALCEHLDALCEELRGRASALEDQLNDGEHAVNAAKQKARDALAERQSLVGSAAAARREAIGAILRDIKASEAEARASRLRRLLPNAVAHEEEDALAVELLALRMMIKCSAAYQHLRRCLCAWLDSDQAVCIEEVARTRLHELRLMKLVGDIGSMPAFLLSGCAAGEQADSHLRVRKTLGDAEHLVDLLLHILAEEGGVPLPSFEAEADDLESLLHGNEPPPFPGVVRPLMDLGKAIRDAELAVADAAVRMCVEERGSEVGDRESQALADLRRLLGDVRSLEDHLGSAAGPALPASEAEALSETAIAEMKSLQHLLLADAEGESGVVEARRAVQQLNRTLPAGLKHGDPLCSIRGSVEFVSAGASTAARADEIRDRLQAGIDVQPRLAAETQRAADLAVALAEREKQITSMQAQRAQLVHLLAAAEGRAASGASEGMEALLEERDRLRVETAHFAEAIDVLQRQNEELEAAVRGVEAGPGATTPQQTGPSGPLTGFAPELDAALRALAIARDEVISVRNAATAAALSSLRPLPLLSTGSSKAADMASNPSFNAVRGVLARISTTRAAPRVVLLGGSGERSAKLCLQASRAEASLLLEDARRARLLSSRSHQDGFTIPLGGERALPPPRKVCKLRFGGMGDIPGDGDAIPVIVDGKSLHRLRALVAPECC